MLKKLHWSPWTRIQLQSVASLPHQIRCLSHDNRRAPESNWFQSNLTRRSSGFEASSSYFEPRLSAKLKHERSQNSTVSPDKQNFTAARKDALQQGNLFNEDGKSNYSVIELRKACTCSKCVDPSDKQKNYSSADIPTTIDVKEVQKDAHGNYDVTWVRDVPGYEADHVSHYSAERIRSWLALPEQINQRHKYLEVALWDKSSFSTKKATFSYDYLMSNRQGLADVVRQLWRTGLAFVSDVPKNESSVQKLAERVGVLRNTFYGPTWNVKSVPNAKNVAYTDRYLGFHMDLLYMDEPPAFQLLHCLENTCTGGESQFADTLKAVDLLASQKYGLKQLRSLMENAVRYKYDNDGYMYKNTWPTIKRCLPHQALTHRFVNCQHSDILARVSRVYWSPPFESDIPNLWGFGARLLTEARYHYSQILNADDMIVETRLEPGTCAIFDNTRVVHARKSFDANSGDRWLKGAYVNRQDFLSVMAGISDLLPPEEVAKVNPRYKTPGAVLLFEPVNQVEREARTRNQDHLSGQAHGHTYDPARQWPSKSNWITA